jgi:hypothetical protein
MFTSAKKLYNLFFAAAAGVVLYTAFVFAKNKYSNPDFGKTFGAKAIETEKKLLGMKDNFALCGHLCNADLKFIQSIVYPEVMRYNSLKDDIEAESLRTLYVQFGAEYANFSIGIFQMKPTFAEEVETKAKQFLADSINKELQLEYTSTEAEEIRRERVERLKDEEWQLIYLTAFISICNNIYHNKEFSSATEKLQWYATVYNAGFDKTDNYICNKIKEDNFYLEQGMPGKKFKYAAIAAWYYSNNH